MSKLVVQFRPFGLLMVAFALLFAGAANAQIATMATPTPGSTLTGSTVTFTWNAGTNISQYYLYVGSVQGGNDLYGQNQNLGLTATVSNLPTDGRTLYVRLWSLVNGAATDISIGWHFNDYQYLAQNTSNTCGTPAPAQLTTPAPNSTLPGSTATFQWTGGSCVTQYTLSVGTSVGASDIYGPTAGSSLSQTVTTLPTDGSTVYVRLTSTINGSPQSTDYTYTAFNGTGGCSSPSAASITNPTPGSTISGTSATFSWSTGCGVTQYYLYVGHSLGTNDIYGQDQQLNQSAVVNNLPNDGSTLYVRLWSFFGGIWHFNDYTYKNGTGSGCGTATPATMITPTNGSTLTGASQVFTWNAGACVSAYSLQIGNEVGGSELYGPTSGTSLSQTVTGLPTDGRPLFVRLSSIINGQPQSIDYTYIAFSSNSGCGVPTPATMTTPTPGSTLTGASTTFVWGAGCSVTEYYLYVGSIAGGNDLYGQDQGNHLTATVPNLPTNGQKLYVRLWSLINSVWSFNDYTYTASGSNSGCTSGSPAVMTSPTPSTVLTGGSVTFTWTTGTCVTSYTLSVGNESGGTEIFTTTGTSTSAAVTGLPTAGQTVFVRLTSLINGIPQSNDYTYTAFSAVTGCGASSLATMTTPAPGSTLSGSTVTFTWAAGCNVNQYYLYVGTAIGLNNLYGVSQANNLSGTVPGLPTNGTTLYVRLWSFVTTPSSTLSVGWHFNDYAYTAGGSGSTCSNPAAAQITSPTPGTTLPSGAVVFTWNSGTCVAAYTLSIGSSAGGSDLFMSTPSTAFTVTVSNLPTNGQTLFVRLSSLINGSNQNVDYTYTAATTGGACGSLGVPASMLTPTPGSTLPGSSATFTWSAGCNAGQYYLYVGSSTGANDIYGASQATNLSGTVGVLPTNGQTLYVRLWTFLNTAASDISVGWHFIDYTYTAASH